MISNKYSKSISKVLEDLIKEISGREALIELGLNINQKHVEYAKVDYEIKFTAIFKEAEYEDVEVENEG